MINNDPIQKVDNMGGIPIAIEWPAGSERRKVASDDPITMRADYGYFPGTEERSDNMELDVYLGPNKESRKVFVIQQLSRESQYDEEKIMLGYDTAQEAQDSYEYHIEKIPVKFGGIREIAWPVLTEMIAMNLKTPDIDTPESKRNVGQQAYGQRNLMDKINKFKGKETYKGYEIEFYETKKTSPMGNKITYGSAHIRKEGSDTIVSLKETIEEAKRWIDMQPKLNTIESRRNMGKQLYSNEIIDDDEAVREGIKVEAEHKDLITWLKAYLKERGEFPPDETIYAQIAVAHLKESPTYYKELAQMEENMNEDGHRKHTPITTQQQADFFGAELGRKERGEKGQTDMSIEELKRHLREWGKKNEGPISMPEDRRNEGARLYGSKEK